jgi:hypothetical protein
MFLHFCQSLHAIMRGLFFGVRQEFIDAHREFRSARNDRSGKWGHVSQIADTSTRVHATCNSYSYFPFKHYHHILLNSTLVGAMATDVDERLRQDLLFRLRWDLSGAVEDIEIATGSYSQTVNMAFLGHPLADESLFDPPLSCIEQVNIRDLADKENRDIYYPKEQRYQPPAALKINNEDGSPITLQQFVTELHSYVQRNLEEIKKVKGEMYGEPVTHADGTQGRVITAGRPVKLPDDIRILFRQYNAIRQRWWRLASRVVAC